MHQADILKQNISHFRAKSPSVSHCADRLRGLKYKICTFEDLSTNSKNELNHPIDFRDVTLQDLLDEIVRLNPGYLWEKVKNDLINIFPRDSVLESEVPPFNIKGMGIWRVLAEVLDVEKKGITLFAEFGEAGGPPINLSLECADLRKALNEIVNQFGQATWHISGRPGAYFLTISAMPDHG